MGFLTRMIKKKYGGEKADPLANSLYFKINSIVNIDELDFIYNGLVIKCPAKVEIIKDIFSGSLEDASLLRFYFSDYFIQLVNDDKSEVTLWQETDTIYPSSTEDWEMWFDFLTSPDFVVEDDDGVEYAYDCSVDLNLDNPEPLNIKGKMLVANKEHNNQEMIFSREIEAGAMEYCLIQINEIANENTCVKIFVGIKIRL